MRTLVIAVVVAMSTTFAAPAFAEDQDAEWDEQDYLEEIMSYLELAEHYVDLAERREAAVFFAVEGMIEIYEATGNLDEAITVLEATLEQFPDNRAARNIIRFQLRDLYAEADNVEGALQQLQAVLEENQ